MVRFNASKGTSTTPKGHVTGGAGGFDKNDIKTRAFAELIERISAMASGYQISERRIAPLIGVDSSRIPQNGFAHWLGHNDLATWIDGIDLASNRLAYVPALLAFLQWKPPNNERLFARPDANGLAAHLSDNDAMLKGMYEIIERDSAIMSWLDPAWLIRLCNVDEIRPEVLNVAQLAKLNLLVFEIGPPSLPPVSLALLRDANTGGVTVGTSCSESLEDAIASASAEALILHDTIDRVGATRDLKSYRSLDRVRYAYSQGDCITNWYVNHAINRPPYNCYRVSGVNTLASACADVYGNSVYAVDVTDRRHTSSKWKVWRVLIPNAFSPNIAAFDDPGCLRRYSRTANCRYVHFSPFG